MLKYNNVLYISTWALIASSLKGQTVISGLILLNNRSPNIPVIIFQFFYHSHVQYANTLAVKNILSCLVDTFFFNQPEFKN